MKILILPDNKYLSESADAPKEGRRYMLEDAATGTAAQNKAFHSLLGAFWNWMAKTDTFQFENGGSFIDLSTPDAEAFKDFFKYKYGQGFSHIQYVNSAKAMVKVKDMTEVPEYVINDFNNGNVGRVKGVLKSWTQYTKKQRKDCIDMLITIIGIAQCHDKKVQEILDGMQNA